MKLKARLFVRIDGQDVLFRELTESAQKTIGAEINRRAMEAAGYKEVKHDEKV